MVEVPLSYLQNAKMMIRDLLSEFECQPILFIGSGVSRRYFNAPDWKELLSLISQKLPIGKDGFEYLCQKHDNDYIIVGSKISELVFEWAWGSGRDLFPSELFIGTRSKDIFFKYLISSHIKEITPVTGEIVDQYKDELEAFKAIRPHAIITTNFDLFVETMLEGYETITGQTIIKYNTNSFGEVYHIHGDVSDFESLVITAIDYHEWEKKKKYVSAKLLTYFAEHPVFIFGYGLNDPNVKSILRDIGELVSTDDGLIKNVVQIIWHPQNTDTPSDQAVFSVDGIEFRIRAVHTTEFQWVFDALKSSVALTSVNPKLVRALAARAMKLVRHDIPAGIVNVDYDVLERVASSDAELPKLLGISLISNANQNYPYVLSQVAKQLGVGRWQKVTPLINKIISEKGVDIRTSDNKYHCKIKTGKKDSSICRKWSQASVDLFFKVKDGLDYELDL